MGTIAYVYSNVAVQNTVGNSGGLAQAGTSLSAGVTPSGYPSQYPFKLRLEPATPAEEVVKVTAGSGTQAQPWTIVRGWDGTTSRAHGQGAVLAHGLTQEDLALARSHEASDSSSSPLPHGLPPGAWAGSAFATISETVLANSTTAQLTFNAIPQTFSHLLLIAQGRTTDTASQDGEVMVVVNGDSTAKYSFISITSGTLSGSLTSPPGGSSSFATTNWNAVISFAASQAGSAANAGGGFALFPNYANSSFNKMFVGMSGMGNGTSSALTAKLRWGYYNPAAQASITSLTLSASSGSFRTGSFFGVYGLG